MVAKPQVMTENQGNNRGERSPRGLASWEMKLDDALAKPFDCAHDRPFDFAHGRPQSPRRKNSCSNGYRGSRGQDESEGIREIRCLGFSVFTMKKTRVRPEGGFHDGPRSGWEDRAGHRSDGWIEHT